MTAATSQSQEAEQRLRHLILDMEVGPGERLTERWLESRLGTSRTPIRAALQRLQSEGLVCREHRRWMVAPIDLDELRQALDYRRMLETSALRLAAEHLTPTMLDPLTDTTARARTSLEAARSCSTDFHLQLAALADNDFINRAMNDVLTRLSRVRWLDIAIEHPGWDEHADILAALHQGNIDEAVAKLDTHLRLSGERLLQSLDKARRSSRARGALVV